MDNKIAGKAKTGISVGFYTGTATQLTQFVFGIILARLLSPADYGIVGMTAIFLVIIDTLTDSGFGVALLQQKEVNTTDYDTVFWINLFLSLFFYGFLFIFAPAISHFYNDTRLIEVIRVIGIVSIIKAIGASQGAYLNKCQHYLSQSKVYFFSIIAGSITAVVFAFIGFDFWSLIIKSFVTTFLLASGWWLISPWKPRLNFSTNSLHKLFPYGSKVLASSILENFFNNIYSLIIGKAYNAQALGYYNRAKGFVDLPDLSIRGLTFSVLFPALSYYQDDDTKLLGYYRKTLTLLAFVLFPVYTILFFTANPLIVVLVTSKWLPAVSLLQILCIKSVFYPFESINGNILYVKGKSDFILLVTVLRRLIFMGLIIVALQFGIKGLMWGLVADAMMISGLNYLFAQRVLKYNIWDQIKDIRKVILLLLVPGLAMYLISHTVVNPLISLSVTGTTGVVCFLFLAYRFMNNEFFEVLKILKLDKLPILNKLKK